MIGTLLAVCGGKGFQGHMEDFAFAKAIACEYFNSAGVGVTALLVFSAVGLASYIRTGSLIIPVGLFMMTGGAVAQFLPGPAMQIVGLAIMLSGAGVFAYAYMRYSR